MGWLSITEYSVTNRTSPSTIRRRIKNKSIKFKLEGGKYFILDDNNSLAPDDKDRTIRALREEIAELKMLISILEKQKDI